LGNGQEKACAIGVIPASRDSYWKPDFDLSIFPPLPGDVFRRRAAPTWRAAKGVFHGFPSPLSNFPLTDHPIFQICNFASDEKEGFRFLRIILSNSGKQGDKLFFF